TGRGSRRGSRREPGAAGCLQRRAEDAPGRPARVNRRAHGPSRWEREFLLASIFCRSVRAWMRARGLQSRLMVMSEHEQADTSPQQKDWEAQLIPDLGRRTPRVRGFL